MPFNHAPANALNQQQQRLLSELEQAPISLIGIGGENLTVDLSDVHNNFVTNVIIEQGNAHQFPKEYWTRLRNRLDEYTQEIQSLSNAQESANEDYDSVLQNINETIAELENGALQEPIQEELLFGSYCPDDRTIHLYLEIITNYANTNNYNPDYVLAYVYIREMFHAFYHQMAGGDGNHYIREIEEPMAECGMLCYLKKASEELGRQDFAEILQIATDDAGAKQNGHLAALGFGLYLYESVIKKNREEIPYAPRILGEYAQKSKLIDPLSFNVIRYSIELIKGYPAQSNMPHEGERILFDTLVHQILNVEQQQALSFVHLYEQMKSELERSLLEQWQPKGTKFDPNYQTQLEDIIEKTVSDNILVENMSPWQSAKPIYKGGTDYTQLIESKMLKFLPYEHQVRCWEALRSAGTTYKSMVVTTGTGSGKTESFMVPLISDLVDPSKGYQPNSLKAIFLYPLNALMEDQKSKLNDLIEKSGGDLTFAVYNGSSPSWTFNQERVGRLSHEVVYREEIRGTHHWDATNGRGSCELGGGRVPDIILTNPTMLEYMLLRKSDEPIIERSKGNLSWIVIDETHTYNGAGANELAMLIRRVLKAFRITDPSNVHFATSSATVGDYDDDLLEFISGITGQNDALPPNNSIIKIIKGHRSTPDFSMATIENRNDRYALLAQLKQKDYVYLQDLIPYKNDVIERLVELDRLCQGGLKVKIHFYVEALTNGLYANLEDIMSGAQQFNLVTEIPFDTNTYKLDSRYVGVVHCKKCGAVLANCSVDDNNKYYRIRYMGGGLNNMAIYYNGVISQPNARPCDIAPGNQIIYNQSGNHSALLSSDFSCPCCGSKDISSFNVSSASCMRSITPVLLNNASKHEENPHPYYGQQFISFADSRRGAAQPSLKQNLLTEEHWVISTLLKKLKEGFSFNAVNRKLTNLMGTAAQRGDTDEQQRLIAETNALLEAKNDEARIKEIAQRNGIINRLSWEEALHELYNSNNSTECEQLAACFAKEKDWDSGNGRLKEDYLRKYVLGALYNVMKRRSKNGFSAESYGIFQTCYPQLRSVTKPQEVNALNAELAALGKPQISDKDWQDYLKIYLDFNVRTNEYLFFKGSGDWENLDIEDCRNLKTTYGLRRSVKDPKFKDNNHPSFHYKLLWRLFGCDDEKKLASINPNLPSMVDNVVKAMWEILTDNNKQLLVTGQRYYKAYGENDKRWHDDVLSPQAKDEHRENKRLNVASIHFCLYDDAYREENVKAILDTTFMGHTPYQDDYKENPVLPTLLSPWNPPYPSDENTLDNYYSNNQVSYLKCKRVENLYSQKPIFIQYEHTAQVHRDMAKQRIEDFKEHDINILACSTTMEMGVDIGELEIVSMSNIPPHPANYKQRAGRAGRAFQNKSACVTICNSDAVGTAVLKEPKEALLERELMPPSADLKNSPQVVQRHVNSYLLRGFFVEKVTGDHTMAQRNIQSFEVFDFFLDYDHFDFSPARRYRGSWRVLTFNNDNIANSHTDYYPKDYDVNTFHNNSLYTEFREWLGNLNAQNTQIWEDLNLLKAGTAKSQVGNAELISSTTTAIEDLFSHLSHELDQMKSVATQANLNWNRNDLTKYEQRLNYDFVGLLRQNLLIYCSTHQFTPNANMPVNIIELKIGDDNNSFDNPSRDLVVALSEYAPGKSVTIDGKNYTIGGVDWDRKAPKTRIHICSDCGYTWDSLADTECPLCHNNNNNSHHELIVPTAFLPERETDRIVDKVSGTVSLDAQLICTDVLTLKHLTTLCDYDVELPREKTKILYLNKGIGHGYCVCNKNGCGRAVLETQDKQVGDTQYVRDLMYTEIKRTNKKTGQTFVTYEHQNLKNFEIQDSSDPTANDLKRNMFIGGSILTNFSILKPYHFSRLGNNRTPFRMSNITDESILTTLGIIVCEELSSYIPCERQDIDFLKTSFNIGERALCIYDTAKGGAGYSSILDDRIWITMLGRCLQRLEDIVNGNKGVDSIFTRSTMRYFEDVDIKATYDWLKEERNSRNPIPEAISDVYPNAVRSSLLDIKDSLCFHAATLFIQPDINKWNYELDNAAVPSWKETRNAFRLRNGNNIELAFCGDPGVIPAEATDIIKHSEDWATFAIADEVENGIYPLAYIGGWLYMTNDAETANFNGLWGSGEIFAIGTPKPNVNAFTPALTGFSEFFIDAGTTLDSPKELLNLIRGLNADGAISRFIDNAQGHELDFVYMDEHLKSQFGTIMAIQFIKEFIDQCHATNFQVSFVNEEFNDYYGLTYKDSHRRLTDSFMSDADCKAIIDNLLEGSNWTYNVNTNPRKSLPHWRSLTIKDVTNNSILTIKPHGGIANGWKINTAQTRSLKVFFNSANSNMESDIPIVSENTIQYTVSLH